MTLLLRAAVACAATAGLVGCGGSPASAPSTGAATSPSVAVTSPQYPLGVTRYPVAERKPLPALTGRTLDGASLATSQLRGRVLVLNVWASWCEPCRAESPALASLASSPLGVKARFVGLDENDTASAATAFLASVHARYPHLVDSGPLLARLAGWLPPAVPGSLVVDPQGRVAARVVGPATAAQLQPLLAQLEAA